MIDFSCKKFSLDEIIKCSLGLTKAELHMFITLRSVDTKMSAQELAEKVELDVTTVQRGLKKLFELDVLQRFQINLENGGYTYVYAIKSRQEIKNIIMERVHNWVSVVEKSL